MWLANLCKHNFSNLADKEKSWIISHSGRISRTYPTELQKGNKKLQTGGTKSIKEKIQLNLVINTTCSSFPYLSILQIILVLPMSTLFCSLSFSLVSFEDFVNSTNHDFLSCTSSSPIHSSLSLYHYFIIHPPLFPYNQTSAN